MALSEHADYEKQVDISRRSANVIIPIILEYYHPTSVVDVGCGIGAWLAAVRDQGINDILGVDGQWVPLDKLAIPLHDFTVADLRKKFNMTRRYDLAISLEVAEHLPEESAEQFVSSLTSLAPVVLFSAAIPHQGGPGHVNEQWPEYWAKMFEQHGYVPVDIVRPRVWANPDVCWWFAQNTLVYVDRDYLKKNDILFAASKATNCDQLSLVHPKKYMDIVNNGRHSKPWIKRFYWKIIARTTGCD